MAPVPGFSIIELLAASSRLPWSMDTTGPAATGRQTTLHPNALDFLTTAELSAHVLDASA
jgi:hypothetical protein